MKKQFISKILAVVMAFSLVGMTTQASAATTETKTVTAESEEQHYDPLTISNFTIPSDNKVNKEFCASISTKGGKGQVEFNFMLLKDGQQVSTKNTDYHEWSSADFYFTPRETGTYTLYVEIRSQSGERLTTTKEFTVAEADKEISAPSDLHFLDYGDNTIRLLWNASVAKNCEINAYYLIVDGGAKIISRYQQFYDFKLDDQMHTAFVIGESQDGANITWSPYSNTIIIPAASK